MLGVYHDFPWLALLPVAAVGIWLAFTRLDILLLFLIAAVPLSLNLEEMEIGGLGVYLPTEPLLAGLLLLFILRAMRGFPVDQRLLRHPLTYWVSGSLVWILLTAIVSEYPVVSLKFFTARLWFIVGFFFFLGHLFLHAPERRHQFILAYAFPLCIVIIYTLIRHAGFGFEKDAGHWVMKPFYKDHTSYGAALAMVIPPVLALLTWRRFSAFVRVVLLGVLAILVTGMVFSYTRAAWVSLAAVGALFSVMKLGVRLRTLVSAGILVLGFLWVAQDALLIQLQRNEQDSSDDLAEHVESISNVSSDASNLSASIGGTLPLRCSKSARSLAGVRGPINLCTRRSSVLKTAPSSARTTQTEAMPTANTSVLLPSKAYSEWCSLSGCWGSVCTWDSGYKTSSATETNATSPWAFSWAS